MMRQFQAHEANENQWVQNPTIVIEHKPVARFRVRGWGIKEVDDPALIKALLEGGSAANPHVAQALVREGLFVEGHELPREVKFEARLSFSRQRLQPRQALGYGAPLPRRLCLNPRLHWQTSQKVNKSIRGRAWPLRLLAERPELWVDDPSTGVLFPFWPDADVRDCILALQSGASAVSELTQRQRVVLHAARILIREEAARDWQGQFERSASRLRHRLRRDGYLALRQLFSPLQLAALRGYFRALEREGYLHRGDSQVERRLALYREPLSQCVHAQLAPLLAVVTGEPLVASYSYFGVYLPGAVLERHKDRPQCRWNLSLVWDTRPERGRADAWPIYVEVNGQAHRVKLGMGDGLLYRGSELFHWRDKQPPRSFTTATFFHFVRSDFDKSLD